MAHAQKQYDEIAEIYDILEHASNNSETPNTNNHLIEEFRNRNLSTVLDMTAGTGIQSIALAKAGFNVTGTDLSEGMLNVAKRKSGNLNINYQQADMRDVSMGHFDAIISMYNAIGHLSIDDFKKTVKNAYQHLNQGGVYAFDIFNTELIRFTQEYEYIDSVATVGDTKYVRFTSSRFNPENHHIEITQKTYVQKKRLEPQVVDEFYSLQTYSKEELNKILYDSGFEAVKITGEGMLDVFGMPGLCHLGFGFK